ncbi:hypothetical protein [Calidifontibacter terrae]
MSAGVGATWARALNPVLPGEWRLEEQGAGWPNHARLVRVSDGLVLRVGPERLTGRIEALILWPGQWRAYLMRRCTFATGRTPEAAAKHVARSLLTPETADLLQEIRATLRTARELEEKVERTAAALGRPSADDPAEFTVDAPGPGWGRGRCHGDSVELTLRLLTFEQAQEVVRALNHTG